MDISDQPHHLTNQVDAPRQGVCIPGKTTFDEWTSLIAEIEKRSPVDVEKLSQVYENFLSEFPLCYGYWKKYAGHKARLCTVDKAVEVYERAVQSATYSVDLWVNYCSFGMILFEDPAHVQSLFERGISYLGRDYLCSLLWDKYIEYEYTQKNWRSLAHIYIRTLKHPTKKLHSYYDSFKRLAAILEEEIKFQSNDVAGVQEDAICNGELANVKEYDDEDITVVIKDLLDPAVGSRRLKALQKYLSIGEQFYQKANELDAKICFFESHIRRPYFHVKPLDVGQLENWHQYLDFVETHGDFDWTVKLHERCLVPCASYPEFWMRYMELMEGKGGRELADTALVRATQIFLKRVPAIHLFCARFKEKIGDAFGSRAAFHQYDSKLDSSLIENVRREANLEKRLGNLKAAFHVYEEALRMAAENQKSHIFSGLSYHFSRFKYLVTGNVDAARDVLIKGIHHLPHSKLLIQELFNFEMMHRGPKQLNVMDSIVGRAISPGSDVSQGLSNEDREDISSLYLEFLDQCGTIDDIMKAWKRHRKLFPHSMRPTSYDQTTGRQDMVIALPPHAPEDPKSHSSIPESQPENSPTVQSQSVSINTTNEKLQPEQSEQELNKQNLETSNLVMDSSEAVKKKSDDDSNNDVIPPSLETLSLSLGDIEIQDSNPTTSRSNEIKFPCNPQTWQNPPLQHQVGAYQWPAQQCYPQVQGYQYPPQYGHMQGNQAFMQMWQYYYQQQQQQQQYQQQVQQYNAYYQQVQQYGSSPVPGPSQSTEASLPAYPQQNPPA